jgi:hypothetical protein
MGCPQPVLNQPVTLAAAGSTEFLFEPPEDPFRWRGWFLSLTVLNATTTSRAQVSLRGRDGLPNGRAAAQYTAIRADLAEGATRVYVPWPWVEVTFDNGGADTVDVQAQGLPTDIGGGIGNMGRYLMAGGTPQTIATGASANFTVPAGATHWRAGWATDLGGAYQATEQVAAGSTAVAMTNDSQELSGRQWTPLSILRTPGSDRNINLAQASGGPADGRVEFLFDLWQTAGA